ncbi:acyl-CoA dehydratase activase [Marispirochaeta aestuarii]|uniref:acyl-CoA dehydratase activase n=1 Tax=Marispirochaeta aestuarii TaxID=1963862 RepID=UPI002ABD56A2|nr:acyl-CoA dehydratase activase [Marispirochaeta aestuarii]
MKKSLHLVGLDIGSVSVSLVRLNSQGELLGRDTALHGGHVEETISRLLNGCGKDPGISIAATGSVPSGFVCTGKINSQVALIRGVREKYPEVRGILHVGGERFGLLSFDASGEYRRARKNSGCAAGTGSFLDQQAERLGLSGSAELAAIADTNTGEIPPIATRCAVFAKTDLIHAQQEGWSLASICDGLCRGLARNIVDSLFTELPDYPILMCGGVALNGAVRRHLQEILKVPVTWDAEDARYHAARGAALELLDTVTEPVLSLNAPGDRMSGCSKGEKNTASVYPPLSLNLSNYPDFRGLESYRFAPPAKAGTGDVEVDIYQVLRENTDVYFGIDVGSTSTKAVLMDPSCRVLAGFYTRTSGRPVRALQGILAAVEDVSRRTGFDFQVIGCGTTGSGRKLAGAVLGVDTVLDEISAHARAAVEINPEVDTIIEIGGQDAKFTTLKNGQVTSSIMNNVCAAGTGSFLEEQGQKLGIKVEEYTACTEGVAAPLSSDRCTVFMQRDLNHLLCDGWKREEVLAAALHAVRENYLQKVAVESRIGEKIFFQGATAKIKTLVAAFEQKLGKAILVSPWCHLTGALGAALELSDRRVVSNSFRGLALWRERIPVRSEVCDLCTNHCKLTVAEIAGTTVACGFLCGRDYGTGHYVRGNGSTFNLLAAEKKAEGPDPESSVPEASFSVGLPSALYLREDLLFWKTFFAELGIPVVSGEGIQDGVAEGRRHTGAEFCAPLTELHGQVHRLADSADYVFLPVYMETTKEKKDLRKFCYYSQFAPAILADQFPEGKLISPVVQANSFPFKAQGELYNALKGLPGKYSFLSITRAIEKAAAAKNRRREALEARFEKERNRAEDSDVQVVILGRPYTVLSPFMNKGIPEIFAKLGVTAFYQDMLPSDPEASGNLRTLLEQVHWYYASAILEAAETVARTPGLYPVFVSSFKCSPDSYLRSYFRQIMDARDKPYLILELDEHGSSVGYETRIEAALRSFRNHRNIKKGGGTKEDYSGLLPDLTTDLRNKTVLLPNWDPLTIPLIAANLKREGVDARVLSESADSIRRGLRHNDGQCIPMNAVAEEAMDYVRRNGLDPANTVLWMMKSDLACNIALYPHHIRYIFRNYGGTEGGMDKLGVFTGDITFGEVSITAAVNTYFAFLFGGLLRRIGCRLRPYEMNPGETDRVITRGIDNLKEAFLGRKRKEDAVREIIEEVEAIPVVDGERPKVAIFGDIYVRDNDVFNNNLLRFIEAHGGEVITTPYSQYAKMISDAYFKRWFAEYRFPTLLAYKTLLAAVELLERSYQKLFERVLPLSHECYDEPAEEILERFGMKIEHTGESMDNILKVWYIKRHYPEVSLFVQTSPGFCCAGLVTESMTRRIEEVTGVPVVSLTYDGTGADPNEILVPYLRFPLSMEKKLKCDLELQTG